MANDGYAVAKELRKMNMDVDLGVNKSDFGMALPEWEDGELVDVDPYAPDLNKLSKAWTPPSWIRYFDFQNKTRTRQNLAGKVMARFNLIKMMREYDIIESQVPYPIYSQFSGVPYAVYDAGWIRYFPYRRGIRNWLAKRGYGKARSVMITNPDTFEISDSLSYIRKDKTFFVPFAIDPEKYKPMDMRSMRGTLAGDDELLLFSPARQMWAEKGNDKMIRGFAKFAKEYPNARLIMVAWSVDEDKSKQLASSLGLNDKVEWIKPVPKNDLIRYYNAADVILDQFVLGSWGTSTPEAMSCGRPVLMFYKEKYIKRAFGDTPPILNSFTEDEIKENLLRLARDVEFRLELGRKSRDWISRTHAPRVVAAKHLEILTTSL